MQEFTGVQRESGKPAVSVIIVSDYAAGGAKTWGEIRDLLAALGRQRFQEPVEFLLCECEDFKEDIPAELVTILPSLRVLLFPTSSSFALKNEGARVAAAEIIVLIDADCVPSPDWLQHLWNGFRNHPEAVAVSGRTTYEGKKFSERVLGLLSRSYLDPGSAGETRFISNNNGAYRRSVYLDHPLPTDAGPFAARVQSEAIRRSGGRFFFEPGMSAIHIYEGWGMERDLRRNAGYSTITIRLHDRRIPYAWLTRLGYVSIPVILAGLILKNWWDCVRCAGEYGVHWFEIPVALLLAVVVNGMEIPGMVHAFGRREISKTAYR